MYSRPLKRSGLLVALSFAVACSGTVGLPNTEGDLDGIATIDCDVDSSTDITQPFSAAVNQSETSLICPRADRDYWKVSGVGGGRTLLNVDIQYNKLSAVELQADFYGPRGRCMDNAVTACAQSSDCPSAKSYCDTDRGGCRDVNAPICFSNTDCVGQQCFGATSAIDLIGTTRIPASTALLHRLNANFPAFQTGDYTIAVYDHAEKEEDAVKTYALTVTTQIDADPNEPNDLLNQAKPLADQEEVSGAMSYIGDVDYFVVTPTINGQPAVVLIDLSYSATAAIAPSWSITQGTFQYLGPDAVVEGSGSDAIRRQKTAVVTPASGPIYIRVENGGTATNITDSYKLRVEVTTDPTEGVNRNDLVANATDLNAGAPGSGNFFNASALSLVAANDIDWYRVAKNTGGSNSLLHILNDANTTDPYSLVVQVYRPNDAEICSDTVACSQGRPCSKEGRCLDLLVQRPSPDGPGDPNLGGLVQNYLETQLPFFASPYYVRVVTDGATRIEVDSISHRKIDGYDFHSDHRYHLSMDHRAEPDAYDASATPDNTFVARPLTAQLDDFQPIWRTSGFATSVVAPVPGSPIAVIPSSRIAMGSCTAQTVSVFDGLGKPNAAATSVAISATGATITASCGGSAISTIAVSGASVTIGVTPSAADVVITTTVTGGSAVTSYLTTSTANGDGVTFQPVAPATTIVRGIPANNAGGLVRLRLPSTASAATTLTLTAPFGVQCASTTGSGASTACVNDDGGSDYCDPVNPTTPCRVIISPGGQTFDVRPTVSGTGIAYLTVNGQERVAYTVYTPGHANSNGYSITGYLTYDGDQDFFEIPAPTNGIGPGGMTIFLKYPASQVDIRASIMRGDRSVGVGYGGDEKIQESCDTCEGNAPEPWSNPANCYTQRLTCAETDHVTVPLSAGPQASTPACGASVVGGDEPIRIWVNEKSSNDWDTAAQYQIQVIYEEGCPAVCPASSCG